MSVNVMNNANVGNTDVIVNLAVMMVAARDREDAGQTDAQGPGASEALREAISCVQATNCLELAIQAKLALDLVARLRDDATPEFVETTLCELNNLLWSIFEASDKASGGGVDQWVAPGFAERHLNPRLSHEERERYLDAI